MSTSRRRRLFGVLVAAAGLAIFWYFVQQAGVAEVADGVGGLGWTFALVLILSGLRFVSRTAAWLRCIPAGHTLRLRDVLPAFLAGDALGNLAPFGIVVGEPAKAVYLARRAPIGHTLPALAVETLFYTLSIVVLLASGAVALFLITRPPASDWQLGGLLLATLAVLVAGSHWLIWRRIHLASGAIRRIAGLGIAPAFLDRAALRVRDAETRMHRDYPREWSRLLAVAALELSFHVLSIAEAFVVLSIVGDRSPTFLEVFVFEAGNRFVNVAFKFVPMRIGVDEAGAALVADLLGFGGATGVTLAIVRKARMLVWTAAGVAALAHRGLTWAQLSAAAAAPKAVVVIMARSPAGTRAPKSRLRTAVPAESDRRRLYAAFLEDTVAACRQLPGVAVRVAYAPDGGTGGFAALGIAGAELLAQRGDDLAARERAVFDDLFAAGHSTAVMMGSDLPTLPAAHVTEALARLRAGTVVLGPASDGGYYLIGLTAPEPGDAIPDLFTDVRWGSASAFDDTVRAAAKAGVTVERIAPWYDVDDEDGLARLRRDVGRTDQAGRAPATARVLQEIGTGTGAETGTGPHAGRAPATPPGASG